MSENRDQYYLLALWFTLAISSIVKWEPAGFDIMILVLLVVGIAMRYFKELKIDLRIPAILLFLFLTPNIVYFLNYGVPQNEVHFFVITLYCILLWLFFVFIVDHFKIRGFYNILCGYTVSAVLSASLGIIAFIFMPKTSGLIYLGSRIVGLFKDPNVFGPYMIPITIFSLVILLEGNAKKKWFWQAAYVLCTIAVVLSFSRAAWLNLVVSLACCLILLVISKFAVSREGIKQILACTLTIFVFFGLLYMQKDYSDFNRIIVQRAKYQTYDDQRFNASQQALKISLENPLGIGAGQTLNKVPIATHNTYLRVSLENGWLGFTAYIGFLLSSVFRSLRLSMRKDTRQSIYICITALLVGIMANSLFIDTLHWRHFWILLSLAWVDFDNESKENSIF